MDFVTSCQILWELNLKKIWQKNQLTYFSRWFHVPKPIKIGSCNTFETLILGWVGLRGVHSGKGTYYYTNPYFIYEGGRFAGGQTGSNVERPAISRVGGKTLWICMPLVMVSTKHGVWLDCWGRVCIFPFKHWKISLRHWIWNLTKMTCTLCFTSSQTAPKKVLLYCQHKKEIGGS